MYYINEIFYSVQGEGLFTGRPTTFIRFAGCNLHCPWCDTPDALSRLHLSTQAVTNKQILEHPDVQRSTMITLTGGEPTVQDLRPLIDLLRKRGKFVTIETNGTNPTRELNCDWVTCSPKPPKYAIHDECSFCELKYVVDEDFTLQYVPEDIPPEIPIFLQVESCKAASLLKALKIVKDNPRYTLGVQLHKYLGVR